MDDYNLGYVTKLKKKRTLILVVSNASTILKHFKSCRIAIILKVNACKKQQIENNLKKYLQVSHYNLIIS
jgi:hypothetical protein